MDKEVKQISDLCIEIPQHKINKIKLAKQPDLNLCQIIRQYFREYCLNSSLHGIRYLGEKGRTKTERVLWFLFFITSIFLCSQLIKKTWIKWDSMPVIVGFAETAIPVWQVPFPAVTICSKTKIRQTLFNYTAYYQMREKLTTREKMQFSDASLLCDTSLKITGENTIDQSTIDFFHDVAPECDEFLWTCKFLDEFSTCDYYFKKSITKEGICYTFNMLDGQEIFNKEAQDERYLNYNISSEWSIDKGYKKVKNQDFYPKRTLYPGNKGAITILLRAFKQDFDYICKGPNQGFKIFLHSPDEVPQFEQDYITAFWNQEISVRVEPNIMTTSEGLKNYHPSRRNCYFPGEKILRYFKIYAQENCQMECLTNFTLSKCECVAFYMPHAKDTPICGPGKSQCVELAQKQFEKHSLLNYGLLLKKLFPRYFLKYAKNIFTLYLIPVLVCAPNHYNLFALDEFMQRDLSNEFDESLIDPEDEYTTSPNCDCLPGCSSLTYNSEASFQEFNWGKTFDSFLVDKDDEYFLGMQISRLVISFKNSQFMTWRRSELYDQTDFFANCGGLLGLFMGFSFLSLIEIVYFLTLRFFCNIKMHTKRLWNTIKIDSLRG